MSNVAKTGTIAYMMKERRKMGKTINLVYFDLEVSPANLSEK